MEQDSIFEDVPLIVLPPEEDVTEPGPPFAPGVFAGEISVMPLLTPDNFLPNILKLIEGAEGSIYMQTQYIMVRNNTPALQKLVAAIRDKQQAGLDIRLILRGDGDGAQEQLEALTSRGIEPERVKFQSRVHNKGILVDGKTVVVGSQNWSEPGVTNNRDASLLIRNAAMAKYFEAIFLHDWTRLAKHRVQNESDMPMIATGQADAVEGMRTMYWDDYYST